MHCQPSDAAEPVVPAEPCASMRQGCHCLDRMLVLHPLVHTVSPPVVLQPAVLQLDCKNNAAANGTAAQSLTGIFITTKD